MRVLLHIHPGSPRKCQQKMNCYQKRVIACAHVLLVSVNGNMGSWLILFQVIGPSSPVLSILAGSTVALQAARQNPFLNSLGDLG